MLTFELMNDNELDECANIFADSFFDYEYFSLWIRDDSRRRQFLIDVITMEMRAARDIQYFFVAKQDGKIVAFSALCPPNYKDPSMFHYARSGLFKALLSGGIRAAAAWGSMESKAKAPCLALKDSWYINSLTVIKEHEGQGIGTDFMNNGIIPFIKDNGGSSVCLFTNSEINRHFYLKNNFEEFYHNEIHYKGKSLGSWYFKRDI